MGIRVLDCTLRDGAYVTGAVFENKNNITAGLNKAGVDIVECGWLRDCENKSGSVEYSVPADFGIKNSALMFDYGKYNIERLPQNNGKVRIIRIAFYKKNLDGASFAAEKIKSKGYEVFLQASNILEYSEKEIVNLCKRANYTDVNAVYIVDSFGSMFPEDLAEIIPVFDETTNENIQIGFHSHNSIQLSMGLTIQFINSLNRDIVVDSSLCGIGRGAGNCKTELLLEYLNRHGANYDTNAIWQTIKENIAPFYNFYNWEYHPQKGLKGIKGIHPSDAAGCK